MKKIFKILLDNSNVLLIFITIITLVLIISTSLESNRKASINLVEAVTLYTEIITPGSKPLEEDLRSVIDGFSGSYFGTEGKEITELLYKLDANLKTAGLSAEWSKNDKDMLMKLISNYQRMIKDRLEVFNTLFYFLIAGIAIQFIFMLISIRRVRLTDNQLRNSERILRMLSIEREKERLRISSLLHDTILQDLGSLLLEPEMIQSKITTERLRNISDSLREITYQIAPLQLNTEGLKDALWELADKFRSKYNLRVSFSVNGFEESLLDDQSRLTLFRIAQEALNNIRKHARAESVDIKLVTSHPYLIMKISDDGLGLTNKESSDKSDKTKHLGILLMKEKAKSIGASLTRESSPGRGTTITLKYPINKGSSQNE